MKKLFLKVVLHCRTCFGSIGPSRPNEHVIITQSKGEKKCEDKPLEKFGHPFFFFKHIGVIFGDALMV